jgi:UDP-N-acetylglucosamine diphosphorylase / glucose-1-phosphate thymidylyltransferase / UDP-N-acetylgalactosamine diphosphorylase / glucosamine-1-phosphate N-acetyltransferase / galactosamine-1-phosphate N-acetyltransferase
MISVDDLVEGFSGVFPLQKNMPPWLVVNTLADIIKTMISNSGADYNISGDKIIHKTAVIENGAVLNGPLFIGEHCHVCANAYFREGAILVANVRIGAGAEVKSSIVFPFSALAHFNYIGNSIVGSNVNFEAGSIAANHYNERESKEIPVIYNDEVMTTGVTKFGSLVGDNSKIGANAVLSPGTILKKNSVVGRLELINQLGIV